MAQKWWKYKNVEGPDYYVGLYHGDESGHLLVYVGEKIIVIDFNVKSPSQYHFMLGTDTFKLKIDPQAVDQYTLYNETLDIKVDEENVERTTIKNNDGRNVMLMIISGFILLILFLFWIVRIIFH